MDQLTLELVNQNEINQIVLGRYTTSLFFLFLIFSSNLLLAQYSIGTLDLDGDLSSWYDEQIGIENTSLLLGTHKTVSVGRNSHPFYRYTPSVSGKIEYRGETYLNVRLLYDLSEDQVFMIHRPMGGVQDRLVALDGKQIDSFSLEDENFVNLNNVGNQNGIYQILFRGNHVSLLSRRTKKVAVDSYNQSPEFLEAVSFYLWVKGELVETSNKVDYYHAFPELKKEVKQYINLNRIGGLRGNERYLIMLTEFCDGKLAEK